MDRSGDWIDQARGDLPHSRFDLQNSFHDRSCFPSQQSAGKAV
jgi:HEPN domain-containing protein